MPRFALLDDEAMNPKSPPPEHCTPAFVDAFNRSTPFHAGATYRTAASQPDMSTRVIEPTAPAIIPLPSDAPAETIARLSVELAASRAQVARMGKGLKHLRAMYRFSAAPECLTEEDRGIIKADGWCDPKSTLTRIIEPALASTSVDIAVPRERYERMVQALWMGPELANVVAITATGGVQGPATCDEAVERFAFAMRRKNEILAAMDAAGKA